MATKLKDLKITSTDLVEQGANPDAHIRLFKRRDAPEADPPPETLLQKAIAALQAVFGKHNHADNDSSVAKDAKTFDEEMERERLRRVSCQMWDFCYALSDSLSSIIFDGEKSEDDKRGMMNTSLDEFAETLRNAIPMWAAGDKVEIEGDGNVVAKSAAQQAAMDELLGRYAKAEGDGEGDDPEEDDDGQDDPEDGDVAAGKGNNTKKSATGQQKEETDTMKIDKSKMTPEELASLEAIEKKYGVAEPDGTPPAATGDGDVAKGGAEATPPAEGADTAPALHPEVKKALETNATLTAQVEELKKSLEIKDLTAVAKKYEIIGKKADELAPKLYDLKKAGGTAYDDFVGLLDEQVTLVEKGGLFAEIGTARSGVAGTDAELGIKAAEVRKNNADMTSPEAVVKAFEENPELAAQYEAEYYKGRAR